MPAWIAATPNPCRKPFGVACGPLTPAAFMTSRTFFQAVVRPKSHSRAGGPSFLVVFFFRSLSPWTMANISSTTGGTGTARYTPRFRFFKDSNTMAPASKSMRSPTSCRASASTRSASRTT